jgi:hypothetical protein
MGSNKLTKSNNFQGNFTVSSSYMEFGGGGTPTLTVSSSDATDPTVALKTTNTAHQVNLSQMRSCVFTVVLQIMSIWFLIQQTILMW